MSQHYFIGIPMPEHVRVWLHDWQDQLREDLSYGVWTNQADFHITLKFMGAVEDHNLPYLQQYLEEISASAFELKIGELGHFGNPHKPRVIWAGVERANELLTLQRKVEHQCERLGYPAENRSYNPHVTLAKKWRGEKGIEQSIIEHYDHLKFSEKIEVDAFALFKIHPNSQPKYEIIQWFPLQSNG